jgi:hypothetical protein
VLGGLIFIKQMMDRAWVEQPLTLTETTLLRH